MFVQEEACRLAWSLLTEHYGIAPDRLYVSYFGGDAASGLSADEETRHIWLDIGYVHVPPLSSRSSICLLDLWGLGVSLPYSGFLLLACSPLA